jgi:hypothetical protein
MRLFLTDLRSEYGSIEDYVLQIGLSAEQVAATRDHLLEPTS